MNKAHGFLFLSSLLLLTSCSNVPAQENSDVESSFEESSSLGESLEDSSLSSTVEFSGEVPSSDSSSSEDIPAKGSWSLDSSAIEDTDQNHYLNDYSFALEDSLGNEVFFYGDYIQRGKGEWEGTVQMKKEVSYIECRTLLSGTLSLSVKKRDTAYGDFTGIPVFSLSSDSSDWAVSEGEKKEEGDAVVYTYSFSSSYFRLAPGESNAIYFYSANFIPA